MPMLPDYMAGDRRGDAGSPVPHGDGAVAAASSIPVSPRRRRRGSGKDGRPCCCIPTDAARAGIADGDRVRLGNARGEVVLHARLFDGLQPGVVVAESVWPNAAFEGGIGINALTSDDPAPPMGGAVFHDTAVWLRRRGCGDAARRRITGETTGMAKRIAFVGAGAIGGYIGANLTALGHDVTLIDPWPAHVEAMRADGMHLYGMTEAENRTVRVNAMHITDAQQLAKQPPIDIAFIAVKSYDTVWATRLIRQYLAPGGFVVSSQNCINEERIAGVVGWGRTVGCVVGGGVGVELFEPGHVRRSMMKNPNVVSFHVGEPHGRITRRVEELAEMLDGIDTAHATDNLWGERWTKLCVNGMRNGVSAATGLGGNARDSHDAIRRICIRLGGESVRVGQALGFTLGKIGALEPETAGAGVGRRSRRAGARSRR